MFARFVLFVLFLVLSFKQTRAQSGHNETFDRFSHNYKHNSEISKSARQKEHFKAENINTLEQNTHYKTNRAIYKKPKAAFAQENKAETVPTNRNYKQQFVPKSRKPQSAR